MTYTTVAILAFCAGTVVSFFTLPIWVAFMINIAKEGSRTDWLGFFGSIISAAVALTAAIVAWLAVQRQIAIQQAIAAKQTAIQQYAILQGTIAFLQDEGRLSDRIKMAINGPKAVQVSFETDTLTYIKLMGAKQFLDTSGKELKSLEEEFERAGKDRWTFPAGQKARVQVRAQLLQFMAEAGRAVSTIAEVVARSAGTKTVSTADQALAKSINLDRKWKEVANACLAFEALLAKEIARVSETVKTIRESAGL
jgi:hypothetical protein